jgi:hypothetical protein
VVELKTIARIARIAKIENWRYSVRLMNPGDFWQSWQFWQLPAGQSIFEIQGSKG